MNLLIAGAEVDGRTGIDVRVRRGCIQDVGTSLVRAPDEDIIDARGGALLPGLHDHHVHLRALARAVSSVRVGPPDVTDRARFARVLRGAAAGAPRGGWVRAVGYHESVSGLLDRDALDAIVADRAVRVQHRSGSLWILNSRAMEVVGLDDVGLEGVERDHRRRPTGRLWRLDAWLASVVPPVVADLRPVSRDAARAGVTGLTDATPDRSPDDLTQLAAAVTEGEVIQRLHLMCPPELVSPAEERVTCGPTKVILDDDRLPSLGDLVALIRAAHDRGREVAVHCVTAVQAVLTAAALADAGPRVGDRVEHGAVLPAELLPALRRLGVTVVTQPNFVAERGDQYLHDVDPEDLPGLYRCASLVRAGIPVAAGTDAPFGGADPWEAMAAATRRQTASGAVIGLDERVDPPTALALFLGDAARPDQIRRIVAGGSADLCLLHAPLRAALDRPHRSLVAATIVGGELVADLR